MNQKSVSKKISIVIIAILAIEIVAFAGWYMTQPSYKSTIVSIVDQHESSDQSYYFDSLTTKSSSLDSIFNAVNVYSSLQKLDQVNIDKLVSFILSKFNTSTGLFTQSGFSSLSATFDAVSTLSILNQTSKLNKLDISTAVMKLQTNDSLYRDYTESNTSNNILVGEVDHLYQALSILQELSTNQTQLLNSINETKTIESMASLQDGTGGIKEGVLYSMPNLQNTYYATLVLKLFNRSMIYYNEHGIRIDDLVNWIGTLYSSKGFKLQADSEPSVEATAYAFISLKNLNVSLNDIQNLYPDGVTSIINFLDSNFISDNSRNTLDVLHDVLFSMSEMNLISRLNKPYFNSQTQFLVSSSIALTIFAFIINTLINLFFMLKEDDTKYFEGKLHVVIQKLLNNDDDDLSDLSNILGEAIMKIEFQPIESDEKLGLLNAYSAQFKFIITYETFNGLAKKVNKYSSDGVLLSELDFLESDIFFTIDEAREYLQSNKIHM